MEIKNVESYEVAGPKKDGSLKITIRVDPHDAEKVAGLLVLGARGVPIDLTIKEAEDFTGDG